MSNAGTVTQTKTETRNKEGIANYTSFWKKNSAEDEGADARNAQYQDVVNGYYDGSTDLYEYGWGQSFHFCRYYPGEPFYQALARHEHYLAHQMGLKRGMRVLDVGCGVGGPAREIARFADVEVVGLNNNAFQVERARKYTEKAGLSDQVTFVKGDFMKISEQFPPNSFDAVYAIEATCHAPTWEGVYGEINKVLKPGGVFGVYEWVMTEKWDPKDPYHKEIAHGIEVGDGIPEMRSVDRARQALKTVGFETHVDEDLAQRPDKIKWYYPLEGDLRKIQSIWDFFTIWRMTPTGKAVTANAVWLLEKLKIAPKGTYDIQEALKQAAVALVEGGRENVFTPMQLFICTKKE